METESETEQEKNKYFTETEITVDSELIQIFISCSPRFSKNVIEKISKTNGLRHSTHDKRRREILRGEKNIQTPCPAHSASDKTIKSVTNYPSNTRFGGALRPKRGDETLKVTLIGNKLANQTKQKELTGEIDFSAVAWSLQS